MMKDCMREYHGPFEGAIEAEYAPIKKREEIENTGPEKSFLDKFCFKAHPEMESLAEIYARTLEFLKDTNIKHQGQNVLITTHCGVMKALFMADAASRGVDIDYRSFDLGNCTMLIVEMDDQNISVKASSGSKFR